MFHSLLLDQTLPLNIILAMSQNNPNIMLISDLPFKQRRALINIFDENDGWEDLACTFKNYTVQEINRLRQHKQSPTQALLDSWGQRNHTVQELFVLFSEMEHFIAMEVIKDFVDKKYHCLLQEKDDTINRLLKNNSDRMDGVFEGKSQEKPTTPSGGQEWATKTAPPNKEVVSQDIGSAAPTTGPSSMPSNTRISQNVTRGPQVADVSSKEPANNG